MNNTNIIPILQYTSIISCDKGDTRFCTTVDKFAKDLHKLINAGYCPISLHDVYLYYQGIIQFSEKVFCLILKGGYEDNYSIAFSVLKKLGIKASIFVVTDLIGVFEYPKVENYIPHFGWDQAQEMIDSGLISIYPFWHPFDNDKNVKNETQKKIMLLNSRLAGNDSSFAFAYDECDVKLLSLLNEIGVKVNITDFAHINLENLEKGALPAISVNHTADIIDTIEQYNAFYQDALDKDVSRLNETAIYAEPNQDVLANSIRLPIDKQPIARNFLRHAFPLSVIQVNRKEKAERMILSDYIEIIYKPTYDWFDYHNYSYEHWEIIEYSKITRDILVANNINVAEYIINCLKAGYYSDIWLDTYYIPGKPGYGRKHMSHGILIYEYDSATQSFAALTYTSKERYQELVVPIKAVVLACSNKYFERLNLIRSNKSAIVEYDIHEIRNKLSDYVNSICHDDNTRCSKKSPQQYYNYTACLEFGKHTEKQAEYNGYIHTTALYGYSEHKRLMMWRLQYIDKYEELQVPKLKEDTEIYIRKAESLVNLGLKFNMTKSKNTMNSVIRIIDELNCAEKALVALVINAIDNKYNSFQNS